VTSWGELHAGDVVVGVDGGLWGVERVRPLDPSVTLVKHGERVTGRLTDPAAPVNVVHEEDTSAEKAAWGVFSAAGLAPEVLEESWEVR
jgi:hypothetical protein